MIQAHSFIASTLKTLKLSSKYFLFADSLYKKNWCQIWLMNDGSVYSSVIPSREIFWYYFPRCVLLRPRYHSTTWWNVRTKLNLNKNGQTTWSNNFILYGQNVHFLRMPCADCVSGILLTCAWFCGQSLNILKSILFLKIFRPWYILLKICSSSWYFHRY